jgi:hypothetical protein
MVQDSTFYATELRQKLNQVREELGRMNLEIDNTQKENANVSSFEKK